MALEARVGRKRGEGPRGQVVIDRDRCKGCGYCVEFCPTEVLVLSAELNGRGYHPPRVVAPERCTGCDLCGMYCPDFAIFGYRVKPEPSQVRHDEG
ncbi:MAG: ferredoxin family protein [Phycisphaerae bacterium]